MKVSVALATYNGSRYVGQLLESLAAQQHLPLELVVGDDCSEDDTIMLIEQFAFRSPFPVRISVNPHRLGYADNFLAISETCTGDVIAFCDQDDVWRPDKLAKVVEGFQSAEAPVLVAHHADVVDAAGKSTGRVFPRPVISGRFSARVLPLTQFPGFTISVRRELLAAADHHRRPDGGDPRAGLLSHDVWLWLLAGCIGESLILADTLVFYRQHENNLFGDLRVTRRERVRRTLTAGGRRYENQAEQWGVLATYLETLASSWTDVGQLEWAHNAGERADRFRARAQILQARADLYLSRGRREAWRRYAELFRAGTYREMIQEGLVSRHAPLKDLLSVLFRRLPVHGGA